MAGGGKHTWRSSQNTPKPATPTSGGTGSGGSDSCDIRFETILNSIDPLAIQNLSRGNKLTISVLNENKVPKLIATLDGRQMGVISHPNTLEVIHCIQMGNNYVAVVLDRQGNLCRVRVERQTA
jgi:hypothetical protein